MIISQNLKSISQKILLAEFLLFLFPIAFLKPSTNYAFAIYYLVCFIASAVINLTLIILHVIKDRGYYIWVCLLLFFLPLALAVLQLFLILLSSGVTC